MWGVECMCVKERERGREGERVVACVRACALRREKRSVMYLFLQFLLAVSVCVCVCVCMR